MSRKPPDFYEILRTPLNDPRDGGCHSGEITRMLFRIMQALRSQGRHGGWSFADQAIVSIGNFLTMLIVARRLAPEDYGTYTLLLGTVLFLNNIQGSLIIYPLLITGAKAERQGLQQLAFSSVLLTAVMAVPGATVLGSAAWLAGRVDLIWCLVAVLLTWQCQEVMRRALMAHFRYDVACWGDAICYLGQATVVWLLSLAYRLTLDTALMAIAATSFLSCLMQAIQVRVCTVRAHEICNTAVRYWELGKWHFLSSLFGFLVLQLLPWVLALTHSRQDAVKLQAVGNVLGVSHPFMFALSNVIIPLCARVSEKHGYTAALSIGMRYGLIGGIFLIPYYVGLLSAPQYALALFYGNQSPYVALQAPLRWMVVAYIFNYSAHVLGAILNGMGWTRPAFLAQVGSVIVSITLAVPASIAKSTVGACAGLAVIHASRALLLARWLWTGSVLPSRQDTGGGRFAKCSLRLW